MADLTGMLQAASGSGGGEPDPFFNQTTLLLHGDGTNGAQNNTFLDSSSNTFTITRNGNTTQGTFSPFSADEGKWSVYFDGNDYLRADTALDDLNTTTSPFTLSFWIYPQVDMSGTGIIPIGINSTASGYNNFLWRGASIIYNDTVAVSLSSFPAKDEWTFVEIIYDGSDINVYHNGSNVGTASSVTFTTAFSNCVFGIGCEFDAASGGTPGNYLTGYMSNLRLVAAALSPSSVPSTPTSQVSSTTFLGLQSNRFVDNSTTPKAITIFGNTSVQPFSPFAPSAAYDPSVNGGSGYFDGTGDYLTAANDAAFAAGTGDFTLEGWLYTSDTTRAEGGSSQSMCNIGGIRLSLNSSTGVLSYQIGASGVNGSEVAQQDAWNHFVIVRSGSTLSTFLNGVRSSTATNTTNLTTQSCLIGANTTTTGRWLGYLANMRFVKATAVYDPTQTTLTVPTSPLTAISGTSILTNFTNAGIFDNTGKNNLETVADAQIDTTTKKWGTGSLEFDGTGDWLIVAHNVEQLFGTGPFTIEGWIYPTWVTPGSNEPIIAKGDSSATGTWQLDVQSTSVLRFAWNSGSSFASTGTITPNQWTHIAVVREGTGTNETKIYINGVNDGTGTVSQDFTNTGLLKIGRNRDNSTAFDGLVDDLRITKGVARYTANFTPPTAPFPDQ